MSIAIFVNAIFFFGMGILAIISPKFVVSFVGLVPSVPDARNEVRAVYGGFGLGISALLVLVPEDAELRSGVLLTVAVALLGMALGRVLSLVIERGGKWPWIFLVMETVLAGLLLLDR